MSSLSGTRTLVRRLLAFALSAGSVVALTPSSPQIVTITPTPIAASGSPHGYGNSSCSAQCFVEYPELFEYSWSKVEYAASTTTEITVATLIYIINNATNQTSTSTQYAPASITGAYGSPGAPQSTTVTVTRGEGSTVTTVVTYPTPLLDYFDEYFIQGPATLSTSSTCKTWEDFEAITLTAHPTLPIPTSLITTDKHDTDGQFYRLVTVAEADVGSDLFESFWQTAFPNQGALASCTPPPLAESSTANTPAATETTAPAESAETHTSVAFLTATTTSHVSIPKGEETPQPEHKPTSTPGPGDILASLIPSIVSTPTEAIIAAGHTTYGVTPTFVGGSTPAIVVDGQTISMGQGMAHVHGAPIYLTTVKSGSSTVTEAVIGHGGGAFGGVVQSSVPVTFPAAPTPQITGPAIVACRGTQELTPTAVVKDGKTVPAVEVHGKTMYLDGGRIEVCGTPVRLTEVTSSGTTVTEVVVGYGGGAFGGAVQSSVPVTFPAAATPKITGPAIVACHATQELTPTAVVKDGKTIPAVEVHGKTVLLDGGRIDVCGTPVRLTEVTSAGATVTEAVVGYGGGAFGGAVQSSVPVTWPASSTSGGLGSYIVSGLGGSPTGSSSAQFTGAAAPVAETTRAGSFFALVAAGVVGFLI